MILLGEINNIVDTLASLLLSIPWRGAIKRALTALWKTLVPTRQQTFFIPIVFGVKVAAMKRISADRSLIAWALYFCVLFNVFACGLGHGQMMGLELNGVGGQFCSALGNKGPTLDTEFSDPSASNWASLFSCPVCSSVALSIALLFCLAWLLRIGQKPRHGHELRCKAPPRYSWPSANPRASPLS
ncbi:hypothetical protein PS723_04704 [Pseudomonas fluorescens]|uniref:DUF2946 domain-containing protein n=2 Tax=Pseudomonas fluorescens TaxID=294 RepID=A0A5E7EL07_PSEFL|nr:hypothetical protein PS723_04704 [Pseudomonas fluorescens]